MQSSKSLIYSGVVATLLCLIAISVLDRPIAEIFHQSSDGQIEFFSQGTAWIEIVFGWQISKLALGLLLLMIGLITWWRKAWRSTANIFLFIAITHIFTRLFAGTLKNVFLRLRPEEVIEQGAWAAQFFIDGGSSFPSGHVAHFWSLFFPLAYLFPKHRLPLLAIPMFILIARVAVNDHFLSDTLASVALAAWLTLFFIWLFRKLTASDLRTVSSSDKHGEAAIAVHDSIK
jgi:membrane-associated phospholipid phosphatase